MENRTAYDVPSGSGLLDHVGPLSTTITMCASPAKIKFLSLEPLLGPLSNVELSGIDWAIVGGESGPGARSMDPVWVRDLRDRCERAGAPYFFKQWGTIKNNPDTADPTAKQNGGSAKGGRTLDSRTWDQKPAFLSQQSEKLVPLTVSTVV